MGIRFNSLAELQAQMPSAISMANNLGKSMVEWSASGFKMCEEEELKRRIELCNSCEHLINKRCLKCGCYIEVKTRLATSKCPIAKW